MQQHHKKEFSRMRSLLRSLGCSAGLAAMALGLTLASPAQAKEKGVFFIDIAALYASLENSFGAPFVANGDLDGVDGPDAAQPNIVLFNEIAQSVSNPNHDLVHDAWIDNFLIARNAMRDNTALSNAVIDQIAAVFGVFMTIQTHEMEHAMEDLWEDELAIAHPDFDDMPWVQAAIFAGGGHGHGDDDDHHHHGDDDDHHHHGDDDDHHHHGDDDDHHHSHGSGHISYFQHIGANLYARIPGSVDTSQPIQWYHNGVAMQDYLGLILGTQSRELELISLELHQSGTYSATYTMGAANNDDDDHHHHGDDDDHHHHGDDDDHHHHGDDDDHHHSHDKGDSKNINKSNATFSFTIQVVDPDSLPASRPYTLMIMMVLVTVLGAVVYRRRSIA